MKTLRKLATYESLFIDGWRLQIVYEVTRTYTKKIRVIEYIDGGQPCPRWVVQLSSAVYYETHCTSGSVREFEQLPDLTGLSTVRNYQQVA